jgi:hypothetical protein
MRHILELRRLKSAPRLSLRYIAESFAQTANLSQSSKIFESARLLYRNGLDVKREWADVISALSIVRVGLRRHMSEATLKKYKR